MTVEGWMYILIKVIWTRTNRPTTAIHNTQYFAISSMSSSTWSSLLTDFARAILLSLSLSLLDKTHHTPTCYFISTLNQNKVTNKSTIGREGTSILGTCVIYARMTKRDLKGKWGPVTQCQSLQLRRSAIQQ